MARMARVVVPGVPHHVIQRGNRKQKVFFREEDKISYLEILTLQAKIFGLEVWAYCLMDNHVHLVVVPQKEEALVRAVGETHQLYTRMINFREGWRGYLWQGRFKSAPMDERYTFAAVRYVERNPVRAKMVKNAQEYKWSSARWHVSGGENSLLTPFYLLDEVKDWGKYLANEEEEDRALIRRQTETGRPLGDRRFISNLEKQLGRILQKQKTGPKGKVEGGI